MATTHLLDKINTYILFIIQFLDKLRDKNKHKVQMFVLEAFLLLIKFNILSCPTRRHVVMLFSYFFKLPGLSQAGLFLFYE